MREGLVIKIERVIEVVGGRNPYNPDKKVKICVYVAQPLAIEEYGLLAIPSGSLLRLGSINPDTRVFELFEPRLLSPCGYATNNVVNRISVHEGHLKYIQTLREVLAIRGIKIKRIREPSLPADIKEILGVYKEDFYNKETTNFRYVAEWLYGSACSAEFKGEKKVAVKLRNTLDRYIRLLKEFSNFRAHEFTGYHVTKDESAENYVDRMYAELKRLDQPRIES